MSTRIQLYNVISKRRKRSIGMAVVTLKLFITIIIQLCFVKPVSQLVFYGTTEHQLLTRFFLFSLSIEARNDRTPFFRRRFVILDNILLR